MRAQRVLSLKRQRTKLCNYRITRITWALFSSKKFYKI